MSNERTIGIIGGGVSGLSAAGLLSRKGFHVKLFEANDKLGGCCANTRIQGYTFDDGALNVAIPRILDHVVDQLGLDRRSLLPLRMDRGDDRGRLSYHLLESTDHEH
jgi:phytoene dehydrogenase-like protein